MALSPDTVSNSLIDVVGLRASGIFAPGMEPSIRTLREWTKLRRIPYIKLGGRFYYDAADVAAHLRANLRVAPDAHITAAARSDPIALPRWPSRRKVGFKIVNFRNRAGSVSYRVTGWLRGVRIRRNFQLKADAEEAARGLELQQADAASEFRMVRTHLREEQVREAEAVFQRLTDKPHDLWFYVDYALTRCRLTESDKLLADAVADYLAAREKDAARSLISSSQLETIKRGMGSFSRSFPKARLAQFTPESITMFLERGAASIKTFNNRRGILSTFFRFARRQGWIDRNPIKKIPQLRLRHRRGSARTISADQAAELMAFLEG